MRQSNKRGRGNYKSCGNREGNKSRGRGSFEFITPRTITMNFKNKTNDNKGKKSTIDTINNIIDINSEKSSDELTDIHETNIMNITKANNSTQSRSVIREKSTTAPLPVIPLNTSINTSRSTTPSISDVLVISPTEFSKSKRKVPTDFYETQPEILRKHQALLTKIADDLNFCRNFQENMLDEMCKLKTEFHHFNDELQSQKELTMYILEVLTTKERVNEISIDAFQKKPKLSGIHQLWWAPIMKESMQKLFSEDKHPSDEIVEKALKSAIKTASPDKYIDIHDLQDGWDSFWNHAYSGTMEFFRNYRGGYVRKIKDRLYKHFNLFDGQHLNQHSSVEQCITWKKRSEVNIARQQLFALSNPEEPDSETHIVKILSDVFSPEEMEKESNMLFGIVVITMMLDPNYQRGDIDSTELVNRMNNWSGLPWDDKENEDVSSSEHEDIQDVIIEDDE